MPAVEALEDRYEGRLRLVKVSAPENRVVCGEQGVMGLPTYVLYRDGAEIERLTGDPTREEIEAAVARKEVGCEAGRSEGDRARRARRRSR